MHNFTLDTLAFITNGVLDPNFILQTPIDGLESPERRMNVYNRAGTDGAEVSSNLYGPRLINLVGKIYATNPTDFEAARKRLSAACSIRRDDNGYPLPVRLSMTTLAGEDYYIDVYVDKPVYPFEETVNSSSFLIPMTGTGPFLFGPNAFTTGNISPPSSNGYISPYTSPYITGAASGNTGVINNTGTVETYPFVYFYGPLHNPALYNSTVGKYIQVNYTLGAGDVAVVDMQKHTIILNNSFNLNSYKTDGSDWFKVKVGLNNFTFNTGNSSDTGYAVATGNPAFVGI